MMKDLTKYWLVRTNQVWKILIFHLLMFLASFIFITMILVINRIWIPNIIGEFELGLASIILGFGSLIWLSQSIKCPYCGYKPVWPILKSAPASEWLARITKLEHCPSCKK